jgi:hypothetical protein
VDLQNRQSALQRLALVVRPLEYTQRIRTLLSLLRHLHSARLDLQRLLLTAILLSELGRTHLHLLLRNIPDHFIYPQ